MNVNCYVEAGVKDKVFLHKIEEAKSKEEVASIIVEQEKYVKTMKKELLSTQRAWDGVKFGLSEEAYEAELKGLTGVKRQKKFKKLVDGYVEDLISLKGSRLGKSKVPSSLDKEYEAILGIGHEELAKTLEKYRYRLSRSFFKHDSEGMNNVIRALWGGEVADQEATKVAQAVRNMTDTYRELWNGYSPHEISKLESFNLPLIMEQTQVKKFADANEFINFVKPLIKDEYIVPLTSEVTGELIPNREAIIDKILTSIYENKITDGFKQIDTAPIRPFMPKQLGMKHQEHRLLHWKDGDSWLAASNRLGSGKPMDAINNYMDMMSRDIAAIRKFGPNPDYMVDKIYSMTKNEVFKNSYDLLMGRNLGVNNTTAQVFQIARNLSLAPKISMATITTISDRGFTAMTNKMLDIPVFKSITSYINGLRHVTHKMRRQALTHMGFTAEYAMNRLQNVARYAEVTGYGKSAQLVDATVRATGLNYATVVGKETFLWEFARTLHLNRGKAFENLPKRLKAWMDRSGISKEDWSLITKAEPYKVKAGGFADEVINPAAIENIDTRIRLVAGMREEMGFAIPETTTKTRAVLRAGTKRGTFTGELFQSATMLKSFPVTLFLTHGMRVLNMTGPDRLMYLAGLITSTTMLGAIALQAKEVLRGKTPRDWKSGEFWREAMLQGGVTGILGDFVLEDPAKFGGAAKRLTGPLLSDAADLTGLLWMSASDLMDKDKKIMDRLGGQGLRKVESMNPLNTWATKLVLERYVYDNINKMTDPQWSKRQRSFTRRMRKERDQKWLWKPGKNAPNFLR
jgi:hypothetical protein